MRLGHFADSHFAVAGGRLDRETGNNGALMDRYRCTRFVIDDGLARGVDLFVGAGDLFNSPKPTPTERRLAIAALSPALSKGVPVVLLLGNHESPRNPGEQHALDTLREVEGLTIVDRPCLLNVWHTPCLPWEGTGYSVADPFAGEPADGSQLVLQLALMPYPNRQLLLRDEEARGLSPGDLNLLVRERMMDVARGLAAQRTEGVPALLVGHWSVDIAEAGKQNSLMMLGGEFTLSAHELQALGFSGALLGHVHKPQQLVQDGACPVVYSGSPEACAFGEEGEEKRYCLWDLEREAGPNEPPTLTYESIPTPYRKLVTIDYDGTESDFSSVSGAIVRLRIPYQYAEDRSALELVLSASGAVEVRTEIERETARRRESTVAASMDADAALSAWLEHHPELADQREALQAEAAGIEAQMGGTQ